MTTLRLKKSIRRSPLRLGFLLIPLVVACFALTTRIQAVTPAPDGGYPDGNTAEGTDALFNLTTGSLNTAIGFHALFNPTDCSDNTAVGYVALQSNTTGGGNTALGSQALSNNTNGDYNTATGLSALQSNITGTRNTATGTDALLLNETGNSNTANGVLALVKNNSNNNTAIGDSALLSNTSGANNTAEGFQALLHSTGSSNIGLGSNAGANLTTGNNNIDIGAPGVAADANTIRIGKLGTQQKTFIAGISGKTVASGVGVIVGTAGQLGTVVSSARFKEAIKPMDKASEAILAMKPVTFHYKEELDPDKIPQFGLVAEEVEKVNPDLVVRDEDGKVMTVRYDAVNAMLLNEFLKEHRKVEEQGAMIAKQQKQIAAQQANAAQQQQQIEALAAGLQKVSGGRTEQSESASSRRERATLKLTRYRDPSTLPSRSVSMRLFCE